MTFCHKPAMRQSYSCKSPKDQAENITIKDITENINGKKLNIQKSRYCNAKKDFFKTKKMAPAPGFEPGTKWLTATYSTAELCRNIQIHLIKMASPQGFEPWLPG